MADIDMREKYFAAMTALEKETDEKTNLNAEKEKLTTEARNQQKAYTKLENHAKNCEKATAKAQKDLKSAQGHTDHLLKSQNGQVKSAERRLVESSRALKEWRDKYGWSVEKPAKDINDLQARVAESQSRVQELETEVTSLKEQIKETPQQIGLHQARDVWGEHQGWSAEVADLQNKVQEFTKPKRDLQPNLTARPQVEAPQHSSQEQSDGDDLDHLANFSFAMQNLEEESPRPNGSENGKEQTNESMHAGPKDVGESSASKNGEKQLRGSTRRPTLQHFLDLARSENGEKQAGGRKNPKSSTQEVPSPAKEELWETLVRTFECSAVAAIIIARRLKALAPGCLPHEAPAIVAYELSGIPVDVYKGLASGKLIATAPPNEVKDAETNTVLSVADAATDTRDLPAEVVIVPTRDMATDTRDLPTEVVIVPTRDMATDTRDLPAEVVIVPTRDMETDTRDLPTEVVIVPTRDMATDTRDLPTEVVAGPQIPTHDMATDTRDLPAEVVAAPLNPTQDMATDTRDLPAEVVIVPTRDMETDTRDLPAEEVAAPFNPTQDMATDTADLPVQAAAPQIQSCFRALFRALIPYWRIALTMIFLVILYYFMSRTPTPEPARYQHQNVYFRRYMDPPTRSLHALAPVTYVHPPTPVPQLGLERIVRANSWGKGRRW